MKWEEIKITELPTKEGWYWVKFREDVYSNWVVYIKRTTGKLEIVERDVDGHRSSSLLVISHWAGPLDIESPTW